MRLAFAIAMMLAASAGLHAQTRSPAFLEAAPLGPRLETPHLRAEAEGPIRVGADGRGTLTIVVTPRASMHVYARDAKGYVPFTARVEPQAGVTPGTASYPKAETYVFPPTGESSSVYMTPFRVAQPVTIDADVRRRLAAGQQVSGVVTLRYQACDDRVCYRPTTGAFTFTFAQAR